MRSSPQPSSANTTAVPPPPKPPRPPRPPCAPDSAAAAARCEGWAARGECIFNTRYMGHHCASSCARAGAGTDLGAECDPDGEAAWEVGDTGTPAMPGERDSGWGANAVGVLPELRTEL